ncbi:MAG: hypothetical protein HQL31_09820 [Planctomycetes bacterium]|nr:hypothetical protein [Planctomycetota bacterium]
MTTLSANDQQALNALQLAASEVLEKKRRLGQYAVIWENGSPVMVGDDAPKPEITKPATSEEPNGNNTP